MPSAPYVIDWKSGNAIYPEYGEQLAGYAIAYEEQTGVKIKYGYIVCVTKKRPHKLIVKRFTLGKRLRNKFLKRLEVYRASKV